MYIFGRLTSDMIKHQSYPDPEVEEDTEVAYKKGQWLLLKPEIDEKGRYTNGFVVVAVGEDVAITKRVSIRGEWAGIKYTNYLDVASFEYYTGLELDHITLFEEDIGLNSAIYTMNNIMANCIPYNDIDDTINKEEC